MKSIKYEYYVIVNELEIPSGDNKFSAIAKILDNGGNIIEHNLGAIFGKTRVEVNNKMKEIARQWVRINEK
jgi:hypothetical protein